MKISVTVPIYKTERYLRECLDSILSQDFDDYEAILVNDGSPDACPEIIAEYAAKDNHFKVISKENGGLVSARIAAITAARGDYIVALDSDDALADGALKAVSEAIDRSGAEIICCSYELCKPLSRIVMPEPAEVGCYDRAGIEQELLPKILLTRETTHMHYYLWAKAFKREFILPYQLAVNPKIAMGEDVCCLIPAYLNAKSVLVTDDLLVRCRAHDSSMSRALSEKHFSDIELVIASLNSITLHSEKLEHEFKAQLARYGVFSYFVLLAMASSTNSRVDTKKTYTHIFKECAKAAEFGKISPKTKISTLLLKLGAPSAALSFLKLCGRIKKFE